MWATYFGGTEITNITDITAFRDYIMITGIATLETDDFPLVEVPDVYFDDINENGTSYISMFNKSTELVWSTFLGDNAGNAGIALTTDNSHPELYMVGNIGFTDDLFDFKPLCDPGGAAFYLGEVLGIATETDVYKNHDGYILGFDISMFESYVPISNNAIIEDSMVIFPIPTSGLVNVNSASNIVALYVYDVIGNLIYSTNKSTTHCKIDLGKYNSGTYLLQIITEKGFFSQLIILE